MTDDYRQPVGDGGMPGEGDAGAEGYEESGSSELTPPDRTGDELPR